MTACTTATAAVFIAESALAALNEALEPYRERRHEGIAYLAGLTGEAQTVVLSTIPVLATTTWGSFHVEATAIASAVRTAVDSGLQVVGQVHTHPKLAFHSAGDEAGARMRYPGYVSIVLPDYGANLPSLDGSASFIYVRGSGFRQLESLEVLIIPGAMR